MIEVESLRRRSKQRWVLDGVTFTVPEGEAFALVGANGSGKTLLLRILATLVEADGGQARIAGHSVIEDRAAVRATIGYMPDVSGVHPGVTTLEDLEFHAGIHGVARGRRLGLAGELLELVGLTDARDDDVERLSRGQRQRLGLARALVNEPAVLLLDDPLGLDPRAQVDLGELVTELRGMGKTIVISGHHLAALEEMCTWAGILEGGSMVAAGPLAAVRGPASSLTEAVLRRTPAPCVTEPSSG